MNLDELQKELLILHRQRNDLDCKVKEVRDQISAIKIAASEWKIDSRVIWRGKTWLVIAISDDGKTPILRPFLKSGKPGLLTKRPYWWNDREKPVVISEASSE